MYQGFAGRRSGGESIAVHELVVSGAWRLFLLLIECM
jgi:hypothetical protein